MSFFNEIYQFVKMNKYALTKQWTMEYDTRDFNRNKIKYCKGKPHE